MALLQHITIMTVDRSSIFQSPQPTGSQFPSNASSSKSAASINRSWASTISIFKTGSIALLGTSWRLFDVPTPLEALLCYLDSGPRVIEPGNHKPAFQCVCTRVVFESTTLASNAEEKVTWLDVLERKWRDRDRGLEGHSYNWGVLVSGFNVCEKSPKSHSRSGRTSFPHPD